MTEHESKELLSLWGIPVTRELTAPTVEQALEAAGELGYLVVLKIDSAEFLHKTDADGVRLDIKDEVELRRAYQEVVASARQHIPNAQIRGVLVQEMVHGGVEMIVGLSHDPQLGPTLLLGLGGTLVELYHDVALRVCPISRHDALEMLEELKGADLLHGYRGAPAGDVDALVNALLRMSDFAMSLGESVTEVDINPLAVLPQGQGVKALDELVVFTQPEG